MSQEIMVEQFMPLTNDTSLPTSESFSLINPDGAHAVSIWNAADGAELGLKPNDKAHANADGTFDLMIDKATITRQDIEVALRRRLGVAHEFYADCAFMPEAQGFFTGEAYGQDITADAVAIPAEALKDPILFARLIEEAQGK